MFSLYTSPILLSCHLQRKLIISDFKKYVANALLVLYICTHPGLVSISFYAIPVCPSTIDNILLVYNMSLLNGLSTFYLLPTGLLPIELPRWLHLHAQVVGGVDTDLIKIFISERGAPGSCLLKMSTAGYCFKMEFFFVLTICSVFRGALTCPGMWTRALEVLLRSR